jgi:hypothetical protein
LPQPLKGNWVQRGVDRYVGVVYPCPRATCKGVDLQDNHVVECWKMPTDRWQNCSSAAKLLCLTGASGPLCGYCEPNFVYSSALRICQNCERASFFSLIIAFSLLCFALLAFGLYTGKISLPARWRDSWLVGTLQKIDSGAFRGVYLIF